MSEFEFIFALFGLLLGLSITEVLGGLSRAIEVRLRPGTPMRIGWLTPLLGAFVLLDLLSFWSAAWISRDAVEVSRPALLAVTMFAGAYYLAAALVFPREIAVDTDLDAHFARVRRIVIGVMLALLLCQLAFYASVPTLAPLLSRKLPLAMTAVLIVLMTAAMAARGRRWQHAAMAALIARYAVVYLIR